MRENTEITTPQGHKLVVNTYLTGRENRRLQNALLTGIQVEGGGGTASLGSFPAERMLVAQDVLIESLVVTMDGTNDNIPSRILDLPSTEYDYIVVKLNEITADWAKKK